jgi:hypothetical protein
MVDEKVLAAHILMRHQPDLYQCASFLAAP